MQVVDYSDVSIVVYGPAIQEHYAQFFKLGGKANAVLKRGDKRFAGIVFSNKKRQQVQEYLDSLKATLPHVGRAVTVNGVDGTITAIEDNTITIQLPMGNVTAVYHNGNYYPVTTPVQLK